MGLLKVLGIGKYLKKVKDYTDQQIANLVGSAPETLDTLQELSTALKDNADIVDTLNDAITKKADKTTVEDSLKNINTSISNINNDLPFEKGEGENSAALKGGNNKATNANEIALGKYNISNSDTQFSIGIGTSDTDTKNAVEAKQNGDVYITGIGGFTGANSSSSKSVQEVINELVDIINQITTSETN